MNRIALTLLFLFTFAACSDPEQKNDTHATAQREFVPEYLDLSSELGMTADSKAEVILYRDMKYADSALLVIMPQRDLALCEKQGQGKAGETVFALNSITYAQEDGKDWKKVLFEDNICASADAFYGMTGTACTLNFSKNLCFKSAAADVPGALLKHFGVSDFSLMPDWTKLHIRKSGKKITVKAEGAQSPDIPFWIYEYQGANTPATKVNELNGFKLG